MASRIQSTLGIGQGLFLLGLLLLHLGKHIEGQEHLVERGVGLRQFPLGKGPQVLVHVHDERRFVREDAAERLGRVFELAGEVEHLLELRAGIGHLTGIDVLEEDEDFRRAILTGGGSFFQRSKARWNSSSVYDEYGFASGAS